tara:strand:+ start:132 stop:863 length:732 start_codon:yes stop_codon:yes gene_type:complete
MNALIGYTGFIGSNLLTQFNFDYMYNSSNISEISGKKIDHMICAGLPGVKWKANKEPVKDMEKINLLKKFIKDANIKKVTHLSTIDVYDIPIGVTEDTPACFDHHPYGYHRAMFEKFMIDNFENLRTIRLPIVYGPNFKKNYLYDLINENNLQKICLKSKVQFYDVRNLIKDLGLFWKIKSKIVNLATEPVLVEDIVKKYFYEDMRKCTSNKIFQTDMMTKYSKSNYFYTKEQTLFNIGEFLK